MRILVTGGAGFIGSHVFDALVADGHEVAVLDARNGDDIRDPDTVRSAIRGVDAISHQAAMVGLETDFSDAPDYVSHNDLGTAVLLKTLAEATFRGRLVLASSMVVYGDGSYTCPDHGLTRPAPRSPRDLDAGRFDPPCPRCGEPLEPTPTPESAPLDPRNVYAATKVHQEHLCFAFSRQTGVPVTALRYHNVYGPRMPRNTPYAGVAAIFASSLANGTSPTLFEDGKQLRDFVHVRDVAHANVLALTHAQPLTGALNIASGTPRTVSDLAAALVAANGPSAPAPTVTGEYRLGDVRHVFASPDGAARTLGFVAAEDFNQGIAEYAALA